MIKQDCPPHRYVNGRCVNRAARTDGNPEGITCREAAPVYPEHEKLSAIADKSQMCGEFLEWLQERYTIGEYHAHSASCGSEDSGPCRCSTQILYPTSINVTKLLAEFFEIDEAKLEDEKRAMLSKIGD